MNDNRQFEQTVKQLLNAQEPDADVSKRLDVARQAAMAAAAPQRQRWMPFAAAASVAVAALVASFLLIPEPSAPLSGDAEDFEMLLVEDNIELLEEMEFYQWLAAVSAAGQPGT